MRIVATMLDGTEHTIETSLWQCLADQFAFRDHFGRSYLAISGTLYDAATKKPREDFTDKWDERWTAFFIWRCLRRSGTPRFEGDFPTFLESIASYDVNVPEVPEDAEPQEGTGRPDPTENASPTTSTETTISSPTLRALA